MIELRRDKDTFIPYVVMDNGTEMVVQKYCRKPYQSIGVSGTNGHLRRVDPLSERRRGRRSEIDAIEDHLLGNLTLDGPHEGTADIRGYFDVLRRELLEDVTIDHVFQFFHHNVERISRTDDVGFDIGSSPGRGTSVDIVFEHTGLVKVHFFVWKSGRHYTHVFDEVFSPSCTLEEVLYRTLLSLWEEDEGEVGMKKGPAAKELQGRLEGIRDYLTGAVMKYKHRSPTRRKAYMDAASFMDSCRNQQETKGNAPCLE